MTDLVVDDKAIIDALDRIAMTPDGALLYAYLQKEAIGILTDGNPSDSALRLQDGRRRFAHRLMGYMAKGIDESGGRNSDAVGGRPSERPVVFLTRQPVVANKQRGAGRRVGPDDSVAGWDTK